MDPCDRQHPYFQRNQNIHESLSPEALVERVTSVLDFMRSAGLNLPILLWAISWNVPELVSEPQVIAERTALMISEELPGILAHWRRPPRRHNAGVRTKAAYDTMNNFALETVCELIGKEINALGDVLASPQDELSEDGLLSIKWGDIAAEVNQTAPTTWRLLRHVAYVSKQESRNKLKSPDTVRAVLS
jgi:hypothetical protein